MAHGSGFWVLAPSQDQPKLLSPDLAGAVFCFQTGVPTPEPEGEGRINVILENFFLQERASAVKLVIVAAGNSSGSKASSDWLPKRGNFCIP